PHPAGLSETFISGPRYKKKPGPCGPGCSSRRPKSAITFQRGTAGCIAIDAWEEHRSSCLQRLMTMGCVAPANNAESRMSAMRGPHATLTCGNRGFQSMIRKSGNRFSEKTMLNERKHDGSDSTKLDRTLEIPLLR